MPVSPGIDADGKPYVGEIGAAFVGDLHSEDQQAVELAHPLLAIIPPQVCAFHLPSFPGETVPYAAACRRPMPPNIVDHVLDAFGSVDYP